MTSILDLPREIELVGIDGCRGGWLCVIQRTGGDLQARILTDLAPLLAAVSDGPAQVAVDMPIGLPEAGPRPCDRQARRLLGHPRGTSVFPAPIRPMLAAASHAEACAIGRARDGRGLTIQAWNLLPRIRQLDALLCGELARPGLIREAHPELIFLLWAGQSLAHAKRSAAGRAERQALIEAASPGAPERCRRQLPPRGWAADDLLDALACLRAAARLRGGQALVLGGECDALGLPMEIAG